MTLLTEALNHVYSTFKARHTEFTEGVSVVGHGVGEEQFSFLSMKSQVLIYCLLCLGSVIVYDILANQGEHSPDLLNTDESARPEQAGFSSGQSFESANHVQAGLKRSLNDSNSSLASLAEVRLTST